VIVDRARRPTLVIRKQKYREWEVDAGHDELSG
jgi:hypothetical protein